MSVLREERINQGLSLTKLACRAGLSPSTLIEFERGLRRPWPRARAALAQALNKEETVLFPWLENESQTNK